MWCPCVIVEPINIVWCVYAKCVLLTMHGNLIEYMLRVYSCFRINVEQPASALSVVNSICLLICLFLDSVIVLEWVPNVHRQNQRRINHFAIHSHKSAKKEWVIDSIFQFVLISVFEFLSTFYFISLSHTLETNISGCGSLLQIPIKPIFQFEHFDWSL